MDKIQTDRQEQLKAGLSEVINSIDELLRVSVAVFDKIQSFASQAKPADRVEVGKTIDSLQWQIAAIESVDQYLGFCQHELTDLNNDQKYALNVAKRRVAWLKKENKEAIALVSNFECTPLYTLH